MPRFPQRFAKLFDYGEEGQLLVQCAESHEPQDGAPFQISITTVDSNGVNLTIKLSYHSEEKRDKDFVAYDDASALSQFHAMQKTLANAAA